MSSAHILVAAVAVTAAACTASDLAVAFAATDPCPAWWGCAAYGHCAWGDGCCQARSNAACAASDLCRDLGLCVARDGFCVGAAQDDADCRRLGAERFDVCSSRGQCVVLFGACAPTEPAHCASSERCAAGGGCDLVGGRCVQAGETDADCRETTVCRRDGKCAARDGRCVAAREADCAASVGCREYGACAARGGICVAARPEHCRASADCERGRCTLELGLCVASDADCARLDRCREHGEGCHAKGGECDAPFIYFQF